MLCICCKISSGKSIRSLYVSTFLTFCIKVSGWIKYIWLLLSFDVHYFVDVYAYQCTWFAWIGAQCRISRQMIYGQLMMGSRNRGRSRKRCMYKDGCTVVLQYYSCTAKQCEWVWEQLSRDNQEGFFFSNFSGKIPKYLYKIIKSLYRYFICEIIFKKPTSNNSLVCRVMHLKTRT